MCKSSPSANHDLTAKLFMRDSVLDGVLHERLEQQRGQTDVPESCRDVDAGAKSMFKPSALDVEIRFDHFEFTPERGEFSLGSQDPAQQCREP